MTLSRGIPPWIFSGQGAWTPRRAVPSSEFHVHMEGCLKPQQFLILAREHNPELLKDGEEAYLASFAFTDFAGFIDAFAQGLYAMAAAEAWGQAAQMVLEDLKSQGHKKVLMFFSPMAPHKIFGISRADLWSQIARASEAVEGMEVAWVVDMIRHWSEEDVALDEEFILAEAGQGVVGIGIGGPELQGPPERFVKTFARIRNQGLLTTAHAGEGKTAEHERSLLKAIEDLNPHRLGHACIAGLSMPAVDALMQWSAQGSRFVDVSPSSNLATDSVEGLQNVPLKLFQERDISFTVNTDDPGFFNTSLEQETGIALDLLSS